MIRRRGNGQDPEQHQFRSELYPRKAGNERKPDAGDSLRLSTSALCALSGALFFCGCTCRARGSLLSRASQSLGPV
jgi:hypothetical protein